MKSHLSRGVFADLLMAALALFGSASCGGGTTEYNYEFSGTDCATRKLTFSSLAAMCTSLQSDSANGSCALAARMAFFTSHCTGTFTESP